MSVVAVQITDKGYTIAADSITVYHYVTQKKSDRTKHTKLFEVNDIVVGACGECDELSMLRLFCATHQPAGPNEGALLAWLSEFVEWKKKISDKASIENSYLICFQGSVFEVNGWFVNEVKTHQAIGAGMDYALAALHLGHSPKEAVRVACHLSIYCEEPIITIKKPKSWLLGG